MIDKHGHSKRRIWGKWKIVEVKGHESYFLLLKLIKDSKSDRFMVHNEQEIDSLLLASELFDRLK